MTIQRRRYRWFYDHVHSRYYNLAMKWCFLPWGGEKKVRHAILDGIDFQPGDKILDMCCGTGGTTFVIAEMVGERSPIKGIDLSRGMIERARRRNHFPNVAFRVMDAERTSFDDGSFDKVFIPHALHEMFSDARLRVLKEARRLLIDGGTLAVLELDSPASLSLRLFMGLWFFYWLPFNFETPTRRDMLRRGLVQEVREAGFGQVSKSSLYDGMFQMIRGQKL